MTSLPFGLSTAPIAFSSVSKWVASFLREKGLRVLVYLDDFLFAHQNPNTLERHMRYAVEILQSMGWCVNLEKSVLRATQEIKFLGIIWNVSTNQKTLPKDKIDRISRDLNQVLETKQWSWESGTALIGRLGFASLVTPLGRLYTRHMQRAARKLSQDRPGKRVAVSSQAIQEARWWAQNIRNPGRIFVPEPTMFVSTDASNDGWGIQMSDHLLSGLWTEEQLKWHINRKELYTVLVALQESQEVVLGQSIMVQSDNRTVVSYLRNQGGTKSIALLEMTKEILVLAQSLNATIHSFYLPGRYNSIADCLSRGKALPDWHIKSEITQKIFRKWGVPQIDLFASDQSKVVPVYVSIDAKDTQALFVNAFSRTWNYELAWIFPPPPLVPRVLQHLNKSSGTFLIVVPRWETVFWRSDLKHRALGAPYLIPNLIENLIDLSTNLPPPKVENLYLEVWKIRGGRI
nr:uncharacterized protein LOC126056144 [Helicoverpa armigera]